MLNDSVSYGMLWVHLASTITHLYPFLTEQSYLSVHQWLTIQIQILNQSTKAVEGEYQQILFLSSLYHHGSPLNSAIEWISPQ